MNREKRKFAYEMLKEALESVHFPSGSYRTLPFDKLRNPDEIILVVLDGKSDVVSADCMVWGDSKGICGSILLQFSRPEEMVSFCYKNGKLSVVEVIGNA